MYGVIPTFPGKEGLLQKYDEDNSEDHSLNLQLLLASSDYVTDYIYFLVVYIREYVCMCTRVGCGVIL